MNNITIENLDTDQLKNLQKQIEEKLKPKSIEDRLKSAKDPVKEAFEIAGLDWEKEIPFINPKNSRQEMANAITELDVAAEVLREGKPLDWENENQAKYYTWWRMKGGFRFVNTYCVWTSTYTHIGARLCQHTEEKSKFLATTFIKQFKTANI